MKKNSFLNKIKKILITVICIITVIFSMPVKSKADAGILESIADLILLIPDGINGLLNISVSDEDEDVKFALTPSVIDEEVGIFGSKEGTLYNFEVTPYDIFTSGTYSRSITESDIEEAFNKYKESYNSMEAGGLFSFATLIRNSIMENQINKELTEFYSQEEALDYESFKEVYIRNTKVKMPLLDANFFKEPTNDSSNSTDILRPVISNVYNSLRDLVLIIMLLILLYIGIKIIITSAVEEQVKYKQYLINWLVGICLIMLMHYIMSAIMYVTQAFNNMLMMKDDGNNYTIAFTSADSEDASGLRDNADWANTASNVVDTVNDFVWFIPKHPGMTVALHAIPSVCDGYSEYQNLMADDINEANGDFWDELLASNDEAIWNFVDKKLAIAPTGYNFIYDEDAHTVIDYKAYENGEPTQLNAFIYGKNTGIRAVFICNIVEYCRAITTFSSKYTHVYSNNKTYKMSEGTSDSEEDGWFSNTGTSDSAENDYSSALFWGYAFLYILLTIETIIFLYKYLKRVLWLAFLTMIAPLIAVMYPVDKVGDGKAQTFNMWFKEYLFNALIQPLHILIYTVFITLGTQLLTTNVIYGIVAYAFMIPAEKFFKKMFGFDKASTPGGLGSPAAGIMAMDGLRRLGGFGPHGRRGGSGGSPGSGTKPKYAKNPLANPLGGSKGTPNSGGTSAPLLPGGPKSGGGGGGSLKLFGNSGRNAGRNAGRNVINNANRNVVKTGNNRFGVLGGMASAANNKLARKITGGRTSSLGTALFTPKGWGNMAWTGTKFVGRNAAKAGSGLAGAAIGAGAGLVAGGLASALSGEEQLVKGALSGAAIGGNRALQGFDVVREGINNLHETGKDIAASKDPEYAAKLVANQMFEENPYMTDDDRDRVEQVYRAGASKEEIQNSLHDILNNSNLPPEDAAFKAHINAKYDLNDPEQYQKAVDKYSAQFQSKTNSELGVTREKINKRKAELKTNLENQVRAIRRSSNVNQTAQERADQNKIILHLKSQINDENLLNKKSEEQLRTEATKKLGKEIVDKGKF